LLYWKLISFYYDNKDTWILSYLSGCHRSKKYWAKPEEFYPEHFLDESGKLKHNIEGFIPFSTGKFFIVVKGSFLKVEKFKYIIDYYREATLHRRESSKSGTLLLHHLFLSNLQFHSMPK